MMTGNEPRVLLDGTDVTNKDPRPREVTRVASRCRSFPECDRNSRHFSAGWLPDPEW
jgi:hypothetical protein